MSDLNDCKFIGVVINEPDIRQLQSGVVAADFNLLLKSVRWNKDTQADEVTSEVFGFQAWNEQAEKIVKIGKGDRVMVTAQASRRMVEKDGKKTEKIRFQVTSIEVLRHSTNRPVIAKSGNVEAPF